MGYVFVPINVNYLIFLYRIEDIKDMLQKLLLAWVKRNWMGRGKDVGLDMFITEEDFLPLNIKQIKIQFHDQLSTKLRFYVKRKPIKSTRTLKQLTLQKLSFLVDKPTSTDNLELPIQLSQLLKAGLMKGVIFGYGKADKFQGWATLKFEFYLAHVIPL